MKITIAIIATTVALFACTYTRLSQHDESEPDANRVSAQKLRETKPKTVNAREAQAARKTELVTFEKYVARRKSRKAAKTHVRVDPRWEFSPRQALRSLGKVRLKYAVPPTDTGANEVSSVNEKRPRHFGLTVWDVKTRSSQVGLKVACMRLVSSPKAAAPIVPPAVKPYMYWGRLSSKDKILATHDVRICGNVVRLTHYLPYGQCNVPHLEYWSTAFAAGGWAVYVNSIFHEGSDVKAAAFDVVRAADQITEALRTAQIGLDRPEFKFHKFKEIWWGNQEATYMFSLEPTRGKEICANLWHIVEEEYSSTGIKGYGTRIIEVGGEGRIDTEVTCSTHNIRGKGFQLDWANEFGIGGSVRHSLRPLPLLIKDLEHGDIQVRIDAALALGRVGLPAVPALTKALKHKEGRVRRVAAIALGKIVPAAKDAVPALIGVLDDKDKSVRYPAVVALRHIGPAAKEALPLLKVMCERDPDSKVRRAAATALKQIGRKRSDRRE